MRLNRTLDGGFGSDNVEVNSAGPVNGKVRFIITPKVGVDALFRFFTVEVMLP
jgi:hypothetical protein